MDNLQGISLTETQTQELQCALMNLADLHVRKEYLNEIELANVVPLHSKLKSVIPGSNMRLFRIDKLSYSSEVSISEKIKTVFESLTEDSSSVVLLVNGKKNHVDLYMGVSADDTQLLSGQQRLNYSAFLAAFPGSECQRLKLKDNYALIDDFFPADESISVAAIPGMKMESYENKPASINKLDVIVDAMKHRPFTFMVVAQPVTRKEILLKRRELEELYSQISPFQKQDISMSQNDSHTFGVNFSTTITNSVSTSEGESISNTITTGESLSEQELPDHTDEHKSNAENTLIGTGIAAIAALLSGTPQVMFFASSIAGALNGISTLNRIKDTKTGKQVTTGASSSNAVTTTRQMNVTQGRSESNQEGSSVNEGHTSGKSVQISYVNKSVVDLLNLIDLQISELNDAENTLMLNVGAYFVAGDEETAVMAANIYRSIVAAHGSGSGISKVYKWSDAKKVGHICDYLKRGLHPRFMFSEEGTLFYPDVTLSQPIKISDLPAYFCLPEKTLSGIHVVKHASFTRDVIYRDYINKDDENDMIRIGNICYMGKEDEGMPVSISMNGLTKHMFVSGATGVGKSNFCYQLLDMLLEYEKKVLIIEPAKGEYAKVFGGRKDFNVYGTNVHQASFLKINPFAFPNGISVDEHIEALLAIFTNAWPMYSAMPAILKDAIETMYEEKGFDLRYGILKGNETFPTFADLLETLPKIIKQSEYSKEVQGNYTGALVTRIKSMTNGVYNSIFCRNEVGDEKLFDCNTIIDMSRIRSEETKALIMGVLVNRLSEYRMCSGKMNSPLQHVTLLEEAHHLLKRETASSTEGVNMRSASVEMISNAIAEMRTYGEGFLIVDQSPSVMDKSVISNTHTKVFFMLPEREDRAIAAGSLELTGDQQAEMARLPTGVAVVYQNTWTEPVLAKIRHFPDTLMKPYNHPIRDIISENVMLFGQVMSVLLYKRMISVGKQSSFDDRICQELFLKDFSWLGDDELVFKNILKNRNIFMENKAPASKIAEVYSSMYDFEKQISLVGTKTTMKEWFSIITTELNSAIMINDDEIKELIGLLIFSRRTQNNAALQVYSEYQKFIAMRGEE